MELLPTNLLPSKAEKSWPATRAARGAAYGVQDPEHPEDKLAVMLMETWVDFGTVHEALRRKTAQQDATLAQLHTTNAVLTKELAELKLKHENLRAAVKRQRKAAVGFMS